MRRAALSEVSAAAPYAIATFMSVSQRSGYSKPEPSANALFFSTSSLEQPMMAQFFAVKAVSCDWNEQPSAVQPPVAARG